MPWLNFTGEQLLERHPFHLPGRLASRVAFRFPAPLESSEYRWLRWDWPTFSYAPFEVPARGQGTILWGPAGPTPAAAR